MQKITGTVGEAIMLGEDIQITILGIEDERTTIGVNDLAGEKRIQNQSLAPTADEDPSPSAPLISGNLLTGS